METNRFKDWGFNLNRQLIISGPCSVESEENVMTTAQQLKDYDFDILRGGIWKPRTRPNSFEGHGEKALPWLKAAGDAIGKPIAVEVATPQHVEACLKADVDYLWIGARTSVNPFAVQEIADSLKGVSIPVMIKNPINPDLKLWLGAVERVEGAGINKIAVIHRGFSYYGGSIYRNQPIWEIPIEFRQERPDLPIICDPSHIAGKRDLLLDVSQRALDLGFDGLMLESHHNPDEAMSDAKQQVTPSMFSQITNKLTQRQQELNDELIDELRSSLHKIDNVLLQVVSERMDIAREIGKIKKEKNVTIYQPNALSNVIENASEKAKGLNLSDEFIHNLYIAIHNESVQQQTEIFNTEK